jgi:hypothetical protein
MPVAFESALNGVFARCDAAFATHLDKVKARSEALQSQDTSRLAFTLTEAIEAEVTPAIDEALALYDGAINRPITPNARWEDALVKRIELEVDAAVARALKIDDLKHPWKPLLSDESPKLRTRLIAHAEKHFAALRDQKRSRRRTRPTGIPEAAVRGALFVGGLVVGAIAAHLVGY